MKYPRFSWARICKRLRGPEIDSEKSISQAYAAWRAGTSNRVVVPARQAGNRSLGSLKGLQIQALYARPNPFLQQSRLLNRYLLLKTTWTVFPPLRIFPSYSLQSRMELARILRTCIGRSCTVLCCAAVFYFLLLFYSKCTNITYSTVLSFMYTVQYNNFPTLESV